MEGFILEDDIYPLKVTESFALGVFQHNALQEETIWLAGTATETQCFMDVILSHDIAYENRIISGGHDKYARARIQNNQEIEQSGMNYVAQILNATAGYQDYKSGGPQSLTRAFLRGNETDHTLVLINYRWPKASYPDY